MSLLITGCNGQLGFELCRQGIEKGIHLIPRDLPELDITDAAAVRQEIERSGCSIVVNAAAYTAVDRAEKEEASAYQANCIGPDNIASACSKFGLPLIHISTDYVFDGEKTAPYKVTDPASPINAYGRTKAAGEERVRHGLDHHIIIRTAWLYGVHGSNFVKTMLRLFGEKEILSVVCDQIGSPTNAADLAEAILQIVESIQAGTEIKWGTYHYTGQGTVSWYDFATAIFRFAVRFKGFKVKKIEPISSDQFVTPAKRPTSSVLDCSSIERCFGIRTKPWPQSLESMLVELYAWKRNEDH